MKIREMTSDDFDIFRTLYRDVKGSNRPYDFDRWRLLETPFGICPTAVAVDNGKLAGFYTIWPVKIRLGDETVLGAQSMDTMTHPNYRRQGLFTKLALFCYEMAMSKGYEILYGFPNSSSYPGFIRRLNWDHTGDITHWIRPIKPSFHPKVPRIIGPVADLAMTLIPKGIQGHYSLSIGKPSDNQLKPLLESWCTEKDICSIVRTVSWIKWRYSLKSQKNYQWICAFMDEELRAVAVWNIWKSTNFNCAEIVELLGEDQNAVRSVLREIIIRAGKCGATLLGTLCNVESVINNIQRVGFFRHKQFPLIVRKLTNRNLGSNIHNHAAWRIMGGDFDVY